MDNAARQVGGVAKPEERQGQAERRRCGACWGREADKRRLFYRIIIATAQIYYDRTSAVPPIYSRKSFDFDFDFDSVR